MNEQINELSLEDKLQSIAQCETRTPLFSLLHVGSNTWENTELFFLKNP